MHKVLRACKVMPIPEKQESQGRNHIERNMYKVTNNYQIYEESGAKPIKWTFPNSKSISERPKASFRNGHHNTRTRQSSQWDHRRSVWYGWDTRSERYTVYFDPDRETLTKILLTPARLVCKWKRRGTFFGKLHCCTHLFLFQAI